jgi:uncharacterized protein (TIGR02001 family)
MMKVQLKAAVAALCLAAAAGATPALAQETDVAFNAAVVSDYVFRGVSQTLEEPAIQAGVDVTNGGVYVGAWASNVDFGDDTDAEIDIYGGYRAEAGGFALDVGVIGYFYAGEPDGADYNFAELKVAASRAIGPATIGAAVYYSPDFYWVDETATYAEVNAAFSPIDKVTVSGAVGKQWLDVSDDYATWNVGATYAFTDALALDVRYHGTDVDAPLYDDRVVGAIKVFF